MELGELLGAIEPLDVQGGPRRNIQGLEGDSRLIREEFLYVAIPGHHCDGLRYVDEALQRGACAIVSESPGHGPHDAVWIRVPDARDALARLAACFQGYPAREMSLVGVTGTNGKTTTTHLVAQVFEAINRKAGLIGTIDYRIGLRSIAATRTTPEPVNLQRLLAEMRDTGCSDVVMEVSSHAIDQRRIAGLDFRVAAFTNLSRDHLDYHGTMEEYFETKASFVREVAESPDASTALNVDDEWIAKLAPDCAARGNCLQFGRTPSADVCAENVVSDMAGTRATVRTPWGHGELVIKLPGDFNLSNSLAALTCLALSGVDLDTTLDRLSHATPVPGRIEEVSTVRGFRVFVDYAHTDDALMNVLRTLKQLEHNRLVLVFGCGGDRDASKRPAMGQVASELADCSIITSDNPRTEDPAAIIDAIREGFEDCDEVMSIADRREAIGKALEVAVDGDVIVIAGKGHENFQDFGTRVVPFDDRAVVRELLEE